MKKYILFLFLVSTTSLIISQNSDSTKPAFKFEKELINYGKIEQNAKGNRVFKFTNIGKSPLIITDIKTSCDCAVPKKPTDPIMPGEKGSIEVIYDTSNLGGFSKQITIFSNAKKNPKIIRVRGFIVKKV